MSRKKLSRRQFVTATALTSAGLISAPYVRSAYAAGKLTMGFWDHWVPGSNQASTDLVDEWAAKEKVEVSIDYITSVGNKNLVTIAAEAAAQSGHDIMALPTWWAHSNSELLEPVNDLMGPLIKQNGEVNGTVNYLGQLDGKLARRSRLRRQPDQGPLLRIDLMKKFANIDVQEMYPAGSPPKADNWDHGYIPEGSQKPCQKGGVASASGSARPPTMSTPPARSSPRSAPSSSTPRRHNGQDRRGAAGSRILQEADFVPAAQRGGLGRHHQQQMARLGPGRPDHESAERLGRSPSATRRRSPSNAGRMVFRSARKAVSRRTCPTSGASWNFSKNKEAAKSLLLHLSKPESIEKMVVASGGYDLPAL